MRTQSTAFIPVRLHDSKYLLSVFSAIDHELAETIG